MEAQEYEVTQFKVGNFQDPHGNTWCDMVLGGITEPVRIVVKDPNSIKEGMTLYGRVTEQTSKAGKTYLRFKREQRPEGQNHGGQYSGGKREYQPRDDAAIRAQWAIGQAVQIEIAAKKSGAIELDKILEYATDFYVMVDRVKDSGTTVESPKAQGGSGYEKAKQVANTLKARTTDEVVPMHSDAETESLIASYASQEHGINMDDIPF